MSPELDGGPLLAALVVPKDPRHTGGAGLHGTRTSWTSQGEGPWQLVELDGMSEDGLGEEPDAERFERALSATSAPYVAFLHAADQLEPGILPAVLAALEELGLEGDPRGSSAWPALVTTDDQWTAEGGEGVHRTPWPSLRLVEQIDGLGELMFVRRDVLDAAGGPLPTPGTAAAAHWDLGLRVLDAARSAGLDVLHLPVLGLWRADAPVREEAHLAAGRTAVLAHLERTGVEATVETVDPREAAPGGQLRVWRALPSPAPLVSVVVPTGGGRREIGGRDVLLVEHALASLTRTTRYDALEIVLVASEGTDPAALDAAVRAAGDVPVRVVHDAGVFNFSRSVNLGVAHARGEHVVLLNDDVEILEPRWIERMVSVAVEDGVGAVGAKLLFEDGRIQHVGVVFTADGDVRHAHIFEDDAPGPHGQKVLDLDVSAVTGACLLVRRDLYAQVGGFTEDLPLNYNDVDFCLKLRALGLRNVVTPAARLHHFESSTRQAVVTADEEHVLQDWRPWSLSEPNTQVRGVR